MKQHSPSVKHQLIPYSKAFMGGIVSRSCFTALFHETVSTVSSMFQRRET
ncbi:MAG TPA: hypothetical protein VE956_18480 [Nodularia sp. (in: cyanobacteria)]|nr:hypothetical protein [Nodularia sp. (in: cyanobacteria)]